MFSHTAVAFSALVLAGLTAAQSTMTVNTPASVVQCQPVQLSWSGGTGPYFPSIIPGQQPGAAALKEFPSQSETTLTWKVDLIANTYITFQVRDSTGSVQYSSAVSIQNSSDSSCLNGGSSATGGSSTGATSGAATTPVTSATTPAATSGAATTPATSASGSRSASGSASSSASRTSTTPSASSSNSASMLTKSAFGVAGVAGLIGAALF